MQDVKDRYYPNGAEGQAMGRVVDMKRNGTLLVILKVVHELLYKILDFMAKGGAPGETPRLALEACSIPNIKDQKAPTLIIVQQYSYVFGTPLVCKVPTDAVFANFQY